MLATQKPSSPANLASPDLATLAESFALTLRAQNKSPRTIQGYLEGVALFDAYLRSAGMPRAVAAIHREHVEAFIADQLGRHRPSTARTRYRSVQQLFRWLVAEGEVRRDPMTNMLPPAKVVKQKPVWTEPFQLKQSEQSRKLLESIHAGTQEEIRLRAAMMASVDEGVGMLFDTLERTGQLECTFVLFLGDNGYFFGEHGLGPERRFAYEAGIRSPFTLRFPPLVKPGLKRDELVICQDIAPTLIELAGGRPGPQIQGRSLVPLLGAKKKPRAWRKSVLIEYWAEQALPWLVGMTYKAVRTDRHKYIHWVNRGRAGELDELYDLDKDPWELKNLIASPAHARARASLRRELKRLVPEALDL